ncbi:hypothetical protein Rmet_6423 [Cupriavidus metallidurans CH34]|uniref:Uncharacterized protein n=1 Tax=Cupriavidus metallidurans (strain ATCC 43123 / DSM 2839 / NBRC 102507 / CH34) TaxID=266264 RepID=D3DXM1_CUPMC|nr:hypothetical protein Rmet_6423 [Cupriavidus metallidurans CH34]
MRAGGFPTSFARVWQVTYNRQFSPPQTAETEQWNTSSLLSRTRMMPSLRISPRRPWSSIMTSITRPTSRT